MVTSRPYGFGFELMDIRGQRYAAHGGASGVFLLHFLDEPLTIAVLTNLSNTAGPNSVLIAREIAGFLRPSYLQPHHLAPRTDPASAVTDSLRALLVTLAAGEASPLMTAAHRRWFDATPRNFRTTWFRRLGSIGALAFLTCDDVRGRGVRMVDPVDRICHYRTSSGAETLFVTAWFAADGKVSFVRFGRSDEL